MAEFLQVGEFDWEAAKKLPSDRIRQEVMKRLLTILEEEGFEEDVGEDSTFEQLGADSLDLVEVQIDIEDVFQISDDSIKISSSSTVGEIVDEIIRWGTLD